MPKISSKNFEDYLLEVTLSQTQKTIQEWEGMNEVKAQVIQEAVRRYVLQKYIADDTSVFYIFNTQTNRVYSTGHIGFEAAKYAANQVRKKLGLKWNEVSFKVDRSRQKRKDQYGSRSSDNYGYQRARKTGTVQGQSKPIRGYRTAKGHWKDWDE